MNKKIWVGLGIAVVVLIGGGIVWATRGTDPKVEEIKQFAAESFQNREGVTDEQRRARWEEMRTKMDSLSESQREQVRGDLRQQFMVGMQQRMTDYFAMSDTEKVKVLDEQINRMENFRKERSQRPDAGNRTGGPGGDRQGGPPRGGGGRSDDPEARTDRMRNRLDHTSPEMRAQMSSFMKDLNDRREERGLEPMKRPPFGRGGPH